LERALAIHEKKLAEHHTDCNVLNTNRMRRNFARLLLADGNAAQAFTFSEAALAAHETILGVLPLDAL
jgi:hypothetical protein